MPFAQALLERVVQLLAREAGGDPGRQGAILREVDKLEKRGPEAVGKSVVGLGMDSPAAARLLDQKMREIRGNNRMAALDRVAVLAELNFAHELQQLRDEGEGRDRELARTLGDLHRKLDGLFDPGSR